jgi:hypothetical protein
LIPGLLLLSSSSLGCFFVVHRPLVAVPGDPPAPAMRLESVTTRDVEGAPGVEYSSKHRRRRGPWESSPVVTRAGLEYRAPLPQTARWGIWYVTIAVRVGAGAAGEIVDMMWSPASAPRCAGGHPALALLLDEQVHWERPFVFSGEHVVAGRFDEDLPLLQQASVVDVHIVERQGASARETCVRIPATGPGIAD